MSKCMGKNCGAEDGKPHSVECRYERFLSYSGLTDMPTTRYAFFHGAGEECDMTQLGDDIHHSTFAPAPGERVHPLQQFLRKHGQAIAERAFAAQEAKYGKHQAERGPADFEAWAATRPEFKTVPPLIGLSFKESARTTWQASRAALVIELPAPSMSEYANQNGYNCAVEALGWARTAIEASGAKVKP